MGGIENLGIFVGKGECNANCAHCPGIPLRPYSPKVDEEVEKGIMYSVVKSCYDYGARSLSITGSGEPTLSPIAVTSLLELLYGCRREGIEYSTINLYTNGIRIGDDKEFCDSYLGLWEGYGLTTIYLTVHDTSPEKNALAYGVKSYPSLDEIISRIHAAKLRVRANLMLSRENIGNLERFARIVCQLQEKGVDYVAGWPIRNLEDQIDEELSPSAEEVDKMREWAITNQHENFKISVADGRSREDYKKGKKLTLFPNDRLSNSWCS